MATARGAQAMPKPEDGAQQPLLAQAVPVGQSVPYAQATQVPQVPQNVLRAAHEMQTGTGVISIDTADLNASAPVMGMPPPGMSLQSQQPGMAPPGVIMAGPAAAGIAVLGQIQGLCMRQNIRLAELLTGFEQKNRFKVCGLPAHVLLAIGPCTDSCAICSMRRSWPSLPRSTSTSRCRTRSHRSSRRSSSRSRTPAAWNASAATISAGSRSVSAPPFRISPP